MCDICNKWENKEIDSKEAFKRISDTINSTKNGAKITHLTLLSSKILDSEVPFKESNKELDKAWQEENE